VIRPLRKRTLCPMPQNQVSLRHARPCIDAKSFCSLVSSSFDAAYAFLGLPVHELFADAVYLLYIYGILCSLR